MSTNVEAHGHEAHGHPNESAQEDGDSGYYARRAQAIEALLIEKGVCTADEIQQMQAEVESRSPSDGARVVARAWNDASFKARLLADPESALGDLGYRLPEITPKLTVVENTESVHHLVVCTLCSCYPRALLGRPPDWYKSLAYRSRAVADPRSVMREFGLNLEDSVEVRVLDSTADMRFLVLPRRPAQTEGLEEGELAQLVTRDCMIGVGLARSPEPSSLDESS
jgi:nitrile hydratase